ncbi:hypothetical protein HYW32_03670 [Candidatus Berkelbacteria bacterium]|nr:hypothetical protein [Candidatus Berkelbacteria bacterium]
MRTIHKPALFNYTRTKAEQIVELILVGVAVGMFFFGMGMTRRESGASIKNKTPIKKDLQGAKIGVACIEPNGSVHDLEAEVINAVLGNGGHCVATNRKRVHELMKGLDVTDGGGRIVNADLLIAGIVTEQTEELQLGGAATYTQEFIAWVFHHYPRALDRYQYFKSDYEIGGDSRWKPYPEMDLKKIQAQYQKQMQVQTTVWSARKQSRRTVTVDFRCFSAYGEVMGAGVLTETVKNADSPASLLTLAQQIVARLHVHRSEAELELWYGDARAAAIHRPIVPLAPPQLPTSSSHVEEQAPPAPWREEQPEGSLLCDYRTKRIGVDD